jgi:hypothetical protein
MDLIAIDVIVIAKRRETIESRGFAVANATLLGQKSVHR